MRKLSQMNVCINYKCHIMIKLISLKELMLIKQVHQKSVIFAAIDIFKIKFQPYVCNWCHDLLMMSINLNKIAILNMF